MASYFFPKPFLPVDPAARLPTDKQERLCLTSGHLDCPLFEAAAGLTVGSHVLDAARAEEVAVDGSEPQPRHRPIPRTTPVIMDRGGPTLPPIVPGLGPAVGARLAALRLGRSKEADARPVARTVPAAGDPALEEEGLAAVLARKARTGDRATPPYVDAVPEPDEGGLSSPARERLEAARARRAAERLAASRDVNDLSALDRTSLRGLRAAAFGLSESPRLRELDDNERPIAPSPPLTRTTPRPGTAPARRRPTTPNSSTSQGSPELASVSCDPRRFTSDR